MTLYYRNETLFSEIYLEEITRQPEQDEVLASLRVLREYRDYADTSSLNAWTQSYVHEVLAALGFNIRVERPDLTQLFPIGGGDQPVSLCFVTLSEESLDNTSMGRNWAEKIIRALQEHGMQWGLLTNGKVWRIYHLDEPTPYETYLEINLEQILQEQAKDAYQIFHKFMKAENFVADKDGTCQFDRFKKESKDKIDYIEKELANALKQREENGKGVLSDLCMGYVDELRKLGSYDLDDETLRRKIYHGAMLYMFRLLFLFYADARGLLSDSNHALLAEVDADARAHFKGEQHQAGAYSLWERLATIFVDIDQTYNGGLFSPQESEFTQFIEEIRIADRYLAGTLFNLTTYREKNGEERPISYRDMSVRHLGTLYEGLLEHKLFITQEPTEVRLTKGKVEFIPASQGGKLVQGHFLPDGVVYFGSDPSERKSTGSYYTPEYIVDYIVRNTVGEKLKELKETFLNQERDNWSAYLNAVDSEERTALARLLEEHALAFVRTKILTLSVLDPAMGSGHFLVNATNLISCSITEFLNELEIDGETPTGTAYWRRWVVENCIYGVDLNTLAVELAKLSLWILSMAKDQPLSFTNHHLKCGNSLVGARLEEVGNYPLSTAKKEPRQLGMFEKDANFRAAVEDAITKSRLMASRASMTLDDVDEKKSWLAEIEQDLKGYKAICDVHVRLYFDKVLNEDKYVKLVREHDFARAFAVAEDNRYFHWELEYPEIFFERKGFDCVIGNPPYGVILHEQIQSLVLSDNSDLIDNIPDDSFVYFLFATISLAKDGGFQSFIVPTTWLYMSSFASFRTYFLSHFRLNNLTVFKKPVFQGVTVETCITILLNQTPVKSDDTDLFEVTSLPEQFLGKKEKINILRGLSQSGTDLALVSSNKTNTYLFEKISKNNTSLNQLTKIVCGLTPYRFGKGKPPQTEEIVKTRAFDSSYQLNSSYRQYIMGRDFHRYRWQISEERWMKYGDWLAEPRYAAPFDEPIKIVVRQTADSIIGHIDTNQYLSLKNVHNIKIQQQNGLLTYEYLLGLLNSKTLNWWYQQLIPEKGRVFAEVKVVNLGKLPIREIDSQSSNEIKLKSQIEHLVKQVIIAFQQSSADSDIIIKEYQQQIDQLVFQLYGLSEEEIAVVESQD